MKLVIAIIHNEDSYPLISALNRANIRATKLASTGGFLRQGNTTILAGCSDEDTEKVLDIIKENAKTRTSVTVSAGQYMFDSETSVALAMPYEVVVGGATVFVIPIEQDTGCSRRKEKRQRTILVLMPDFYYVKNSYTTQ